VAALKLKILPGQAPTTKGQRTANPEVYNQYLLGRQIDNQANPETTVGGGGVREGTGARARLRARLGRSREGDAERRRSLRRNGQRCRLGLGARAGSGGEGGRAGARSRRRLRGARKSSRLGPLGLGGWPRRPGARAGAQPVRRRDAAFLRRCAATPWPVCAGRVLRRCSTPSWKKAARRACRHASSHR